MLDFYEFPGADPPIIRGSALAAAEGRDPEIGADAVMQLMEACDTFIPEPARDIDKPFLMPVEDVFSIAGRGTVVTGKIHQGKVNVGDEVALVGLDKDAKTTCTGELTFIVVRIIAYFLLACFIIFISFSFCLRTKHENLNCNSRPLGNKWRLNYLPFD